MKNVHLYFSLICLVGFLSGAGHPEGTAKSWRFDEHCISALGEVANGVGLKHVFSANMQPLKISPNGRVVIFQNNPPHLINGRARPKPGSHKKLLPEGPYIWTLAGSEILGESEARAREDLDRGSQLYEERRLPANFTADPDWIEFSPDETIFTTRIETPADDSGEQPHQSIAIVRASDLKILETFDDRFLESESTTGSYFDWSSARFVDSDHIAFFTAYPRPAGGQPAASVLLLNWKTREKKLIHELNDVHAETGGTLHGPSVFDMGDYSFLVQSGKGATLLNFRSQIIAPSTTPTSPEVGHFGLPTYQAVDGKVVAAHPSGLAIVTSDRGLHPELIRTADGKRIPLLSTHYTMGDFDRAFFSRDGKSLLTTTDASRYRVTEPGEHSTFLSVFSVQGLLTQNPKALLHRMGTDLLTDPGNSMSQWNHMNVVAVGDSDWWVVTSVVKEVGSEGMNLDTKPIGTGKEKKALGRFSTPKINVAGGIRHIHIRPNGSAIKRTAEVEGIALEDDFPRALNELHSSRDGNLWIALNNLAQQMKFNPILPPPKPLPPDAVSVRTPKALRELLLGESSAFVPQIGPADPEFKPLLITQSQDSGVEPMRLGGRSFQDYFEAREVDHQLAALEARRTQPPRTSGRQATATAHKARGELDDAQINFGSTPALDAAVEFEDLRNSPRFITLVGPERVEIEIDLGANQIRTKGVDGGQKNWSPRLGQKIVGATPSRIDSGERVITLVLKDTQSNTSSLISLSLSNLTPDKMNERLDTALRNAPPINANLKVLATNAMPSSQAGQMDTLAVLLEQRQAQVIRISQTEVLPLGSLEVQKILDKWAMFQQQPESWQITPVGKDFVVIWPQAKAGEVARNFSYFIYHLDGKPVSLVRTTSGNAVGPNEADFADVVFDPPRGLLPFADNGILFFPRLEDSVSGFSFNPVHIKPEQP